jgi:tetratricopeptide (TPR) repeat protein
VALQVLARRYMGHSHHARGQYRLAEAVLRQNADELDHALAEDASTSLVVSYTASCAWLGFTLVELGAFREARAWLDRARLVAERRGHAYSQVIAWTMTGLTALRQGQTDLALEPLTKSLEVCRDAHLTVWEPIPSSLLGLASARLGRTAEGLGWLEAGVRLTEELGVNAYRALWTAHLGEGLLLAGEPARARAEARRALELAEAHQELGHAAWAHLLLGEIGLAEDADPDAAAASCRDALAIAERLGMRPLSAHCRLGLGRLARVRGHQEEAAGHLAAAALAYRELEMASYLRVAEEAPRPTA